MAYVVQGTSAGGTTVVDRENAEKAYATAREMQQAKYVDIAVTDPDGRQHAGDDLRELVERRAA